MFTNSKIEQNAIEEVKALANKHHLLDPAINDHDKYMAYDGSIYGFTKVKSDFRKADWDFQVPVQIKGHIDKKVERRATRISQAVELTDLNIYYREHGVLYFVVLMDENGEDREVFYAPLGQSKAKEYYDEAAKKKRKASINVVFFKLPKTPDAIYRVLQQFANDSAKLTRQIADDRIHLKDLPNVVEMVATVFQAKNEVEALMRIAEGEACLFGKIDGNPYDIPIEFAKDGVFSALKSVNKTISIDDIVYYYKYNAQIATGQEFCIIPSANLELSLTHSKLSFRLNSDLQTLYNDARFILRLFEGAVVSIASQTISYEKEVIPDNLNTKLHFIVDLYETLEMIEIDTASFMMNGLSEEDVNDLTFIVNLRLGKYNNQLSADVSRYNWSYRGKLVPISIMRDKEGHDENELLNGLYTRKYQYVTTLKGDESTRFIIPLFVCCDAKILSNLYLNDYDSLYNQIDRASINEHTIEAFNMEAIKLISVFDINGNEEFLRLADYLLQKIESVQSQEFFIMNRLQIKKRLGAWGKTEIDIIESITLEDVESQFGKSVLLGDKESADKQFALMSPEMQEQYRTYPIYKLYQELQSA
ncbi:MAG: hypothetical protein IKI64_11610 [Clostridia bacterium]|nr:hypothetical protein [Clostridia bacterium]